MGAEAGTVPEEVRRQEIAALLTLAQAGDRTALDEIMERLMPLVWNVARCWATDRDTASDVVQTVWLTFLGSVDSIRTPAALAAWLITVTRREAVRTRTAHQRQLPVEPETFTERPDPAPDIAMTVAEREDFRCLWRNLHRLSPRCQQLLRIIAYADRPNYAGISEALGMPVGSIGPVRGRCLARLRTLLENDPTWSL